MFMFLVKKWESVKCYANMSTSAVSIYVSTCK